MNIVAIIHSHKFTHYSNQNITRTQDPSKLSISEKLKALIFGIDNPRPHNTNIPSQNYSIIKIKSNVLLECWQIKTENSKGTIVLFHGYSGNKSNLIAKSDEFIKLGYSTFLVDFMGSGGSGGNSTSIGYYEAEEVKDVFNYLVKSNENNIILFSSSQGAVAIMKAIADYKINPMGIIIECPFATMYDATCRRFENMNIPTFPMANLLVFWGGYFSDFDGFNHNPLDYAKSITVPTLMFYGKNDDKVRLGEINSIYNNLHCQKYLKILQNSGHNNYLETEKDNWLNEVKMFLSFN